MTRRGLAPPSSPAQTDAVDERDAALERAHQHTLEWLASLDERPGPPRSVEALRRAAGG